MNILEMVFTFRCLACGASGNWPAGVCESCRRQVRPLSEPRCPICGVAVGTPGCCGPCMQAPPPFVRLLAAARYEGLLRDLIQSFKYRRHTAYRRFLGELLANFLREQGKMPIDLITCVPLHWMRLMQRGYNQSALLAGELGRTMHVPVRTDVVKKTRRTASQVGLDRSHRRRNLRGAFRATEEVRDLAVLVVDDVVTTGQTAREVSTALMAAGASSVIFAAVGRVET